MVSEEKKKHMMTLIKRYRSTAITHKKKADRLWAYAKMIKEITITVWQKNSTDEPKNVKKKRIL